jgi:ligand-binding SRPBCC domain-containing protein
MPVIRIETLIAAPPQRCFDLARDVEVHMSSTSRSGERAIAGVTSGLLGHGDTVTWEATHFGIRQRLTSRMTLFQPPFVFEDEQVSGAFSSFTHRHEFHPEGAATVMVDVFRYKSPLGVLGMLADKLFLEAYMRRFLRERAAFLRNVAEGN